MTSKEIQKAYNDGTWLVSIRTNILVRVIRKYGARDDWEGLVNVGGDVVGSMDYLTNKENLRLATAKELLELSND